MLLEFLGTLLGLGMLVWGANLLVDGAAGIASRKGINGHVIGVTLIATATSLPEFVTAITATLSGNHGIAVGNVVGSNAFNLGIVLAVGVLIIPFFPNKLVLRDGLMVMIATMLFAVFAIHGIGRVEAMVLFFLFVIYVVHLFRTTEVSGEIDVKKKPYLSLISMILFGTVLLAFGAPILVDSAVGLSGALGVEESIIALTLIAAGTSLPELITAVVASIKGHEGMAIGNILGSNLFNILLIPGFVGLIRPLSVSNYLAGSVIPAMLLLTLLAIVLTRKKMSRKEGVLLLLGYMTFSVLFLPGLM